MRIAMKRLLLATMAVLALAAGSPVRPATALSAASSVDARIRSTGRSEPRVEAGR